MNPTDKEVVTAINAATGAGLRVVGRAANGRLGGAIYVEWPNGNQSVVTRFLGTVDDARRTASALAYVRYRGVPVAWHQLVADLGDAVYFVQERIPHVASRLTTARIDGMVAVNETFKDVLADRPEIPAPPMCLSMEDGLAGTNGRERRVLDAIVDAAGDAPEIMTTGPDLVHTDFTAANVLFDEHARATAVVDWNLGIHRGDRWFGLVKTRLDREWFVRASDAHPVESHAAAYLDEILAAKIDAETLRAYWAIWLRNQLRTTIHSGPQGALDWQLALAEEHVLGGNV